MSMRRTLGRETLGGRVLAATVATAVAWMLIAAGAASAGGGGVPVRSTKVDEFLPTANAGWLAWTETTKQETNAFAKDASGGGKFQVNRRGTTGITGGLDPAANTLAYAQRSNGNTDIKLFNLNRGTRSDPVDGVNSKAKEEFPTISGDELLFTRIHKGEYRVLLFVAGSKTQLTSTDHGYAFGGQVNGNIATYERCTNHEFWTCTVFIYDIAAATHTKLSNPDGRFQYAPSVGADGTVYLFRSKGSCGSTPRLVRHDSTGAEVVIGSLPKGTDTAGTTFTFTDAGSVNSVYYDRFRCRNFGPADIWKLVDA